jgi:arylsulfatase A
MKTIASLLFAFPVLAGSLLAADKPNIILLFPDDVGLGNVSACGADLYKTPNIDLLAKTGLRFAQCYAMPQCSPSRCVTLTGRYPFRTGLLKNNIAPMPDPKREVMIPTVMKQAGYVTASVGKWHVGGLLASDWGFDEYIQFAGSGRYWRGDSAQSKYYYVNGQKHDLAEGQYMPDLMHEFLVNFMTKHKEKPFFVYYPMAHIHGTITRTPDSKPGADEKQLYVDNIAYMDKLVGKLVAELERLGIREKTLILFAGDNGTSGDYCKTATVNGRSLYGHKLSLDEGGSRVPLICSWPGVTPPGKVLNDLVDFSDFFTTFADLGGAKLPEGVKLDGHSFAPQLRGEKGTPRDWIYVQLGGSWYVRNQGFKLNESGELFDMSDAPFAEKPVTNEAEKAKLQAVLKELNPLGGVVAAAKKNKGDKKGKKGKKNGTTEVVPPENDKPEAE